MRLIRRTAAVLLTAAGIVACGSSEPTDPVPVPTTLSLNLPTVSLTALGATAQLTATVRDQNNAVMSGATVAFGSGNTAVATVDAAGLVTAAGNGSTNVTASVGALSSQVPVTVAQVVTQLVKTAGDQQSAVVATQLAAAVEVELRDSRGHPVPGGVVPNATVQFVAANGGTAADLQVTANAGGRAATTWALGTGAGTQQLSVSLVGGSATTQFSATATAAAADTVVLVSGNNQSAPASSALPNPLVVEVRDQYGNPVAGHQVDFAATSGGGSVTPTTMLSGANGRASTQWTLGASLGVQDAEAATSPVLPGSPVAFSATATNLSLISVAPDTIVEGSSATLAGTGFDATPANNAVTIGGSPATVTAASPSSLTVTVPSYNCQPARAVDVQVTVGAGSTNTLSHPLKPAATVSLAVGQQEIIRDPAGFCLQFAASAASEAYLIGVQSLLETPSTLTATRLIAATGFPSPAPPAMLPAVQARSGGTTLTPSARDLRWARHREAETRVRAFDARVLGGLRSARTAGRTSGATATTAIVGPGVAVGDTILNVRLSPPGATFCNQFTSITTVVRAKGTRGIWLEDTANPANGYTAADFDSLSHYFDNVIFDTDTSYFGNPGDFDANGRIVVVVTRVVNQKDPNLLGFVLSCDFFARASGTDVSNEGEFFYAKAPDPTGINGSVYSRSAAFADAPFLIAHEFTHIVQFARRIPTGGAFTSWLFEGQATMAEEVNGFAVAGRTPGQNYGFAVAFNSPPSTPIDWHASAFIDLIFYYGFESPTTRKAEAPHECTWIGRAGEGNAGPCIPGREVYGVPWSLYRWASDQFGPTFSGGERGLQKAIIGNPAGGYANLASTLGVAIDTLLAQWAAALYVDDRVPGAAARLTVSSWNLVNIESGLVATARLQPIELVFSAFNQARNVRAGSSAYFRISGTSRPATAIRARTGGDTQLAEPMTLWIVRLQ